MHGRSERRVLGERLRLVDTSELVDFGEGLQDFLNTNDLDAGIILYQKREAGTIRAGRDVDPKALKSPGIARLALLDGQESSADMDHGIEHLLSGRRIKRFAQTVGCDDAVRRLNSVSD